ncbi:MAG: ABC transporter permease [Pseudomonadota bacterium]
MPSTPPSPLNVSALGGSMWRWGSSWWGVLYFGLVALVTALSPSTYNRANRLAMARLMVATTWRVLPWFTLLSALISLVLIRIVVVTAQSYGLSQYALDVVVRVLVLELIPLSAALFVVLRGAMAAEADLSSLPVGSDAPGRHAQTVLVRTELLPRVVAAVFSVVTLAAVSSVVALVLAYVNVYGFTPWGFAAYTRMVGRVFDPATGIGFVLKIALFSIAVAVVPVASALQARLWTAHSDRSGRKAPSGTVRLFLVLVLIEGASLALKYI